MKAAPRFEARTAETRGCAAFLTYSILVLTICTSSARILRTRAPPSETWDPLVPLTLGSNIEIETSRDHVQYEFPMFLEYNFTQTLKLTLEPNVVHVSPKVKDDRSKTGFGDLETALEYEFVRERRYRPAFTAEGVVKWPTASDRDIGSPGTDYSLGLIASKDLVFVDLDLRASYTFVGDPHERDNFEVSLAGEWHLNYRFDVEAEVAHAFGTGGIHGRPGTISGVGRSERAGADLTQGTVGIAWHVSKRLKIEQGAILRTDGTWQIVFAWEWSFSGD